MRHMKSSYEGVQDCFYRVSAKAFIRDENWKFLICLSDDGYWDIPWGGIDHWEDIHEALRREIMEEMWIPTKSISAQPIYVYMTESTMTRLPICCLNYNVIIEHYNFIPSDECREIQFVTAQEAKNYKLYTPNHQVMKEIEKSEA